MKCKSDESDFSQKWVSGLDTSAPPKNKNKKLDVHIKTIKSKRKLGFLFSFFDYIRKK